MGRTVLGIVGAAAGAVYGYYTGDYSHVAQGFAVGYGIGAATESKPSIEGPRLSDLRFTSSSYGQPIPWLRGSPRVSGQIVWSSQKREISSTSSQGKGGGQESTNFTYEMDVLVLLCEHEAAAVSRIWSNGKLVWTRRVEASSASLAASDGSDRWRRLTFYPAAADQLPDPTYEAAVGAGNAPAYRGRATLMIEGLQLGGSGQLPNLTFEVLVTADEQMGAATTGASATAFASVGTAVASGNTTFRIMIGQWTNTYANNSVSVYDIDVLTNEATQVGSFEVLAASPDPATGNSDVPVFHQSAGTVGVAWSGASGTTMNTYTYPHSLGGGQVRFARKGGDLVLGSSLFGLKKLHRFNASGGAAIVSSSPLPDFVNSILILGDTVYASARLTDVLYVLRLSDLALLQTINRPSYDSGHDDTWSILFDLDGQIGLITSYPPYSVFAYRSSAWQNIGHLSSDEVPTDEFNPSVGVVGGLLVGGSLRLSPFRYQTWSAPLTLGARAETVQSVVEALCERAGMPAGSYDASALSTITRGVRSLALTSGGTRGTLEQLGSAFFFNAYLRDKIYFRPRGPAVAATIQWDDLAAKNDQPDDQPLQIVVGNDLELPPQVAVSYINVDDDAQAGAEYSDRMTGGQAAVQTIALGIGMKPAEAKGIADVAVGDAAAALVSSAISLPITYARLDPSDVVQVVDRDGRVYRLRLGRKRDERGVLSFETTGDDATALASLQLTDSTQAQASTVTKAGDTVFTPLDVPLLRDVDDGPGYYVVAKGSTTVWPGGQVLSSSNNVDFTLAAEISESAVFGVCTTTLGDFDGIGFDEVHKVTVNVGNGELATSTRDIMLTDATVNAMLIGAEVVRFRTATMTGPGVYVLSSLLRGQKGTEWAITGHASAERCVLLRARGMRRVTQQASESGQLRYLRAGTLGSTVLPDTTSFTNSNRGLKPWSPVDLRASRSALNDLTLTWKRRSRLATTFAGPAGPNVPLGEVAERYDVEIWSAGFVTLKRTFSGLSLPTVTYPAAQQAADFGALQTAYAVRVFQISATVGRGEPLSASATAAMVGSGSSLSPQVFAASSSGWLAFTERLDTTPGSGLTDDLKVVSFWSAAAAEGVYSVVRTVSTPTSTPAASPVPQTAPGRIAQTSTAVLSLLLASGQYSIRYAPLDLSSPPAVTTPSIAFAAPRILAGEATRWLLFGDGNKVHASSDGSTWALLGAMAGATFPHLIGDALNIGHAVTKIGSRWFLAFSMAGGGGATSDRLFYSDDPDAVTGWVACTGIVVNSSEALHLGLVFDGTQHYSAVRRIAVGVTDIYSSTDGGASWALETTCDYATGFEVTTSGTSSADLVALQVTGTTPSDYVRAYLINGVVFEKLVGTTTWTAKASGLVNPLAFVSYGGRMAVTDKAPVYSGTGTQVRAETGGVFTLATGF